MTSVQNQSPYDNLLIDCRNEIIHLLGTSFIFEERAKKLSPRLYTIQVMGVIVPLSVGGIATSFGVESPVMPAVIVIAGILSVFQLGLSGWGLAANWLNLYYIYKESQMRNKILADEYTKLAQYPPADLAELKVKVDLLEIQRKSREIEDMKQDFSVEEKSKGMRYALYTLNRECAKCNQVPKDMSPTSCKNCGNFK